MEEENGECIASVGVGKGTLCNGDYLEYTGTVEDDERIDKTREEDSTSPVEVSLEVNSLPPDFTNEDRDTESNRTIERNNVEPEADGLGVSSDLDDDIDILFDLKKPQLTSLEGSVSRTEELNLSLSEDNDEETVEGSTSCNGIHEMSDIHNVSIDSCNSVDEDGQIVTINCNSEATGSRENTADVEETPKKKEDVLVEVDRTREEKASVLAQLEEERQKKSSMDEIVKKMENKCFQQQERIEELESELEQAVERAKLEHGELQEKIQEVQQTSDEAGKSRDSVIKKLAVLQEEHRNLIDQVTDKEKRVRELSKENEKLDVLSKKQRTEVLKLQGALEKSEAHGKQLSQDLSKQKEEVDSLSIKVKWTQNKLKTESEAHKNTKAQLEVVTKKLKQAKEEGDMIRADLKKMIYQYQESEEMKSNSLDIKLKKTEEELKQHEQEIADQHELHELTVKELELSKESHKIAQDQIQQQKQKISEMSSRATELIAEIEELKSTVTKLKEENKKQSVDVSEYDQKVQAFEKERQKFSQLREVFTQLQKSHQHIEKELEKRKEKETELLAFSAKLSTSNAELMAERQDWETKLSALNTERDGLVVEVTEVSSARIELQESLDQSNAQHQQQVLELLQQLEDKNRAVEELTLSLEDERELVKATKRKNTNLVKDLQRQLQNSNRRVENLEAMVGAEKEPAAMLPISHAHSTSSLDVVLPTSSAPHTITGHTHNGPAHNGSTSTTTSGQAPSAAETSNEHLRPSAAVTLSDDEVVPSSPSPEYKFYHLDQEKILLVKKMCHLKKELAKQEEKSGFYEDHITQLTADINRKSRIIQSFIVREQSGALAPPSFDENRIRQARKSGVMGSVFSGKNRIPEVNLELSLEMNRKMQCVLEDTLLKNITLKESIDTLGQEIQRMSAQLQKYEKTHR